MSTTERPVAEALRTLLVNNEPFQYAHLIKFERPSRPDSLSGLVSTSKQRYTYLTDASINVSFDDGSRDLQGVANGTQVYLANKVLSVGAIQEQTKATTSNTTLVLDGNALGAEISDEATINLVSTGVWDIVYAAPITLEDLLAQGFREGDKVTVNGTAVNIQSFRAGNALRVTQIDTALTPGTGTVALKLASEEIISILLDKNGPEYASFINREVFIYRGYFKDGVIVGEPTCVFKGIITGVSFEDSESAIKVSWSLSSHWADFAQVKGRITSDSAHRALDANGAPQVASALKPIYAYDKGFIHAETSINMLTKYTTQRYVDDVKVGGGLFGTGLFPKVKVRKKLVIEDNFTNLDFQLQAKSIPVVYGVRKVESIPVFADTLKDNSAEVYLVFVISEGEIGGVYDIIIDGNSLICNDKADFDARSTQTTDNTVETICWGRADRGDVLSGQSALGPSSYPFYLPNGERVSISIPDVSNIFALNNMLPYIPPTGPLVYTNTYGLIDGDSLPLRSPSEMTLDVFTGKAGQKASAQLSQIAFQKNFKIQNSYWLGNDTYEYWGPNHRLLDTAYVVGKFIIAEGNTTIPEINFVVRGKVIDCYNYDFSYLHDQKATEESHSNFSLGDSVSLWDGATKLNDAQIIDKWTFRNPDGTENVRFRFSVDPALNYDADGKPGIKKFQMKSGANTWTMVTHNYNILGAEFGAAGTVNVAGPVVSQVSARNDVGGDLGFTFASNQDMVVNGDTTESSALFQLTRLVNGAYDSIPGLQTFTSAIMGGTATQTTLTSRYPYAPYAAEAQTLVTAGNLYLASKNTVRLPASASATEGFYNGYLIEITRYNSSTGKSLVQLGEIIGYNGTRKIVTIDSIWDFIPISTDTVRIFPKYADSRVSINPAIQLLDYVTSPTYGKGLNPYKDLDLPSWMETARRCDTRSDVTVLISSGTPAVDDVYQFTNSLGKVIWQGTVASISGNYITFTNVIGKLTNKWNSWKYFKEREIVYNSSGSLYTVTTPGEFPTEPVTGQSPPTGMSVLSSLSLTRVSGTGTSSLPVNLSAGNPVQSIRNGQKISGYSIYDCDDINYWRMTGWDEHAQRYVTKDQCNIVIDTSVPLSDNVNGMLEHFNGILRYTAGKYFLDIEEKEGDIDIGSVRTITVDDIIGKIQLSDEGTRSAFNSLTASFADPANKFEAKNVSFFNSDYLKADRNVPKKGNLSIPGITNYYNSRVLADSFLNKSRFGLTVSLTIRPSGFLLLAGSVIQIIYPRYDWDSPGKKFRIESINYQPDGLVDIVAKEYDNSFYTASNIRRVGGTGATTVPTTSTPESPTVLSASQTQYNQIILTWNPGTDAGPGSYTEVWRSDDNNFNNAAVIALVPVVPGETNTYVDPISPQVSGSNYIAKYYWIRRKVLS